MQETKRDQFYDTNEGGDLPPCTKAPEWAEHARFYDDDEPCDDGRSANICEGREEGEPCPVGETPREAE